MDVLCKLHETGRRGRAALSLKAWMQWCSCPPEVFLAALHEIATTEVGFVEVGGCDIRSGVTLPHMDVTAMVTVSNRRMIRESKARESDRLRQQKHRTDPARHAVGHGSVQDGHTVPSSSSSSSPSHWEPPNPLVKGAVLSRSDDEPEKTRPGGLAGLSDALRELFAGKLQPDDGH